MRVSIRFPLFISSVLLIVITLPAAGQISRFALSGHDRQIGPIERSIYSVQRPDIDRLTRSFRISWLDTSDVQQAHIYSLISGGLGGGAAGIVAAIYITSRINFESGSDIVPVFPQFMVGTLLSIILEPLGMATGVHVANKGRGDYSKVVGSAYGSFWIGFLAICGVSLTGIGRDEQGFLSTLVLAIPIYQLCRTIRKELSTARSSTAPVPPSSR